MRLNTNPIIENIPSLSNSSIQVDTLRLDQIHPVVSGNKWYKLQHYLEDANSRGFKNIASFGGPYSNHLVALAFAAKEYGLNSIGYIRTNKGEPITSTMQEAMQYGMELVYLGRTLFQEKKNELLLRNTNLNNDSIYFVNEGGYGHLGAKGASNIITGFAHTTEHPIVSYNPILRYNYIICAVGTGTMIAGLINGADTHQKIMGISVLKNKESIENEIKNLLIHKDAKFELLHQFHQGGYAKTTAVQIEFMNRFWEKTQIPTDIVYTGKLFYGVQELIFQNYFQPETRVLVIHSGGLQGNKSQAPGILKF